MKIFKKIMAWLFLIFAILFTSSVLFLKYNKEEVIEVVKLEINKQVAAEISVSTIDLEFIRSFPRASVYFTNVYCQEVAESSKDTLFALDELFLEFNVWDLITKNYVLQKVQVNEGLINIKRFKGGGDNFHFWKESEEPSEEKASAFSFPSITGKNLKFRYSDYPVDFFVEDQLKNISVSGYYNADDFFAKTKLESTLGYLKSGNLKLFNKTRVDADFTLQVKPELFSISDGTFNFGSLDFTFEGSISEDENKWSFSGNNLPIKKVVSAIPNAFFPEKSGFTIDGKTNLKVDILQKGNSPIFIEANSEVSNGSYAMDAIPFTLNQVSLNAHFTNGKRGDVSTTTLTVKNVKATTKTGDLSGGVTIMNFAKPTVTIDANVDAKFDEIMRWVAPQLVESASGNIKGDFSIKQRFSSFEEIPKKGLTDAFLSGELALQSASWTLPNTGIILSRLDGKVRLMSTGDLSVDRMEIATPKSSFYLSGKVNNALNSGRMAFITSLKSDLISLEELMTWDFSTFQNQNSQEASDEFPFDFSVNMNVSKFTLNKLTGTGLTGRVWSEKGPRVQGNDIAFNTLDGKVFGRFSYLMTSPTSTLWTKGDFTHINIKDLFEDFDDFGQAALSHKNISGNMSASLNMTISHDDKFNFLPKTLTLESDLKLVNGTLFNYKPLENLSEVVDIAELKNVKFSELNNKINIENGVITIPEMTIESSALEDLRLEGKHTFENVLDYSIRLKLSDALGGKKKKNSDFDDFIIEEDRKGTPYIWVKMSGPIDDLTVGMDSKKIGEGIKQEFIDEGSELKKLIKGEDPEGEKKKKPSYTFEWSEEPDTIPESH